jgi:hypothetical protein
VHEQTGKEEYVHLKSIEDEFEYMESNMPKKEAPPEPEEEERPEELESPDGRRGAAPFVDVDGDERGGGSYVEADDGHVPSSRGLGGNNGSKPSFYADAEGEDGGASPGSGMWHSMGGNGWVPPPSSEDAQHGQAFSYSEEESSPPFAKYQEPAGRRRPDLFAADGSPVADRGRGAEAKYGRDGADIWTAESDTEEHECKKAYRGGGKGRGRGEGGGSKELSSDDFRGPDEEDEGEDEMLRRIIAEAKEIALREKEELARKRSGQSVLDEDEEKGVAAHDEDSPPVVRWGTEDDID